MSAVLDPILARVTRFAGGGGILFVSRQSTHYQKGCGVGRPSYDLNFLVLHPKGADNAGTWRLPESVADVLPADAYIDEPTEVAGVLVSRSVEFKPVGDKYDDAMWIHPDFANSSWIHPGAAKAIGRFDRTQNFDQPSTQGSDMSTRQEFIEAQARADSAYRHHNDAAPPPMSGENPLGYEQRLASRLQAFSGKYKNTDLTKIGCPHAMKIVASEIYADATTYYEPGTLRYVYTPDASGRLIGRPVGDIAAFMDKFNARPKYLDRNRPFLTPR
jgi:hypothetical protein